MTTTHRDDKDQLNATDGRASRPEGAPLVPSRPNSPCDRCSGHGQARDGPLLWRQDLRTEVCGNRSSLANWVPTVPSVISVNPPQPPAHAYGDS